MIVLTPPARLLVWSLQVFPSLENWHPRLQAGVFFFSLPFSFFLNHKSMLVFGSLCLRRVRVEVSLCATWVAQMVFFLLKSWIDFFPPRNREVVRQLCASPGSYFDFFWFLATLIFTHNAVHRCATSAPKCAHTQTHSCSHTHLPSIFPRLRRRQT